MICCAFDVGSSPRLHMGLKLQKYAKTPHSAPDLKIYEFRAVLHGSPRNAAHHRVWASFVQKGLELLQIVWLPAGDPRHSPVLLVHHPALNIVFYGCFLRVLSEEHVLYMPRYHEGEANCCHCGIKPRAFSHVSSIRLNPFQNYKYSRSTV